MGIKESQIHGRGKKPRKRKKPPPLPRIDVTTMYDTLTLEDYKRLREDNTGKTAPKSSRKEKREPNKP